MAEAKQKIDRVLAQ
jgi:hypothetical protein